MTTLLGYQAPADLPPGDGEFVYNEETGMEYNLHETPDGKVYIAAAHDGVGLVTWYEAPTMAEARKAISA